MREKPPACGTALRRAEKFYFDTKLFLMMKQVLSLLAVVLCVQIAAAQKDPSHMTDKRMDEVSGALNKEGTGWTKGGDLGLTLNGSGLKNRRLSDGVNQFGFGGVVNLFANQKLQRSFWENALMVQLGALRNGGKDKDFLKNGDILRLNSTWGYAISKDKLFAALDGRVETQLLPAYKGGLLKGEDVDLLSKFLSPVSVLLAPGVVYKPNTHLSFFVSPAAVDYIYVGDEALARLDGQPLGNEPDKQSRLLIGPSLRAKYSNTFLKERIAFNSSFAWNANYRDAMNGRALWANQANIQIYKGLSLKLLGELFYDHYTKAIIADATDTTPQELGLRTTLRGGYFLAYSRIFGAKK